MDKRHQTQCDCGVRMENAPQHHDTTHHMCTFHNPFVCDMCMFINELEIKFLNELT